MASSIVTVAGTTTLGCRNCARWTEFEQPPCRDGHGSDCPEWYCTECGAATLVGWSMDRREFRSRAGGSGNRQVA